MEPASAAALLLPAALSPLAAALLCLIAAGISAPAARALSGPRAGWLLALLPAALAAFLVSLAPGIARGGALQASLPWAPGLGADLTLYADGLALLFALLITGIGALILVYAGGYLKGDPRLGRLYAFLLLFLGAMLGLALSGNLLTLFVFWEMTSVASYLLIGFDHHKKDSRAAALQALLVTGGGGLALLAGLLLVGIAAGGTWDLATLLNRGDAVRAHPLYLPALALVLVGAFTKSAQFPFHFWLPGAMAAPTPVSAYLHSATMVKAGVFLLARLSPVLAGTAAWQYTVTAFGVVTMLVGGLLALFQTDLKRLLAYSTVSALGTLTLLLGLGTARAVAAAMVFLLAHALYKGALFMIAGAVDHEAGTRDVEELGGLRRAMPLTANVALLAAVSLAGVGPVLAFIGKELFLEAVLEAPGASRWLLTAAAVVSGALSVAVAGVVALRPFFGPPRDTPRAPHEAPPALWLGPAVLAAAGLLLGLFPGVVAENLVGPASAAAFGRPEPLDLHLWHGLTPALGLTALSLLLGAGLYLSWAALRRTTPLLERAFGWGPVRGYNAALVGLNRLARAQTRLLQNGNLRHYLLTILLTATGLVGYALLTRAGLRWTPDWGDLRAHEAVIALLTLAAALAAVRSRNRLGAVASLGVVGFGVALIYILFGAPDLAMTQVLVETLTVILFVLVFHHLPRFTPLSTPPARLRDALACLLFGAVMTALVLAANAGPHVSVLAPWYAENSAPAAHGRNIVNVILVDFRALDTLGEITVLAVAAVGVYALLRLKPADRHAAAAAPTAGSAAAPTGEAPPGEGRRP